MKITLDELLNIIDGGSPDERSRLTRMLAPNFIPGYEQRTANMEDARQNFWPRVTVDDADVTTFEGGTELWGGPSRFAVFDFVGASGWIDVNDGNTVHIRQGGGGADCMFDFLVSECWAAEVAAGRGSEGQTMTSLSGCTFKVYSTVQGAVTQAIIDFPFTTEALTYPCVIFICSGIYAETVDVPASLHAYLIGAGQRATVIGGAVSSDPAILTGNGHAGARLWIRNLTIRASTSGDGLAANAGYQIDIDDCWVEGGSALTEFGIRIGELTSAVKYNIRNTYFDGGYGLFEDAFTIRGQIENCWFKDMTLGIAAKDQVIIAGNHFNGCATAISVIHLANELLIANNLFDDCTTCIGGTATQARNIHIVGNSAVNSSTFLDVSGLSSSSIAAVHGWVIQNNTHHNASNVFIKLLVSGTIKGSWLIQNNETDHTALTSGDASWPFFTWSNNRIGNAADVNHARESIDGTPTRLFTGGIYFMEDYAPLTIGVTPCVIRFGDTSVQIARQTLACTASATTHYFEISPAGTLTQNTVGFTVGYYHLCSFDTDANPILDPATWVHAGGILYVQGGGSVGVPGFVTDHTHEATGSGATGGGATTRPQILGLTAGADLTIATGAITVTNSLHEIIGEGVADDVLTTINGLATDGTIVVLRLNAGATYDVQIAHGLGNIETFTGDGFTLTGENNVAAFQYRASDTTWLLMPWAISPSELVAGDATAAIVMSTNTATFEAAGNPVAVIDDVKAQFDRRVVAVGGLNLSVHAGTLVSDQLVYDGETNIVITSETGTTDDLDGITVVDVPDGTVVAGDIVIISPAATHTITVRNNNAGAPAGGKIFTQNGSDITLNAVTDMVGLIYDATLDAAAGGWKELFRSEGASGAGDVATDAIWDAAGDLAVGTGANTAARLPIGAANKFLKSDGTNPGYDYVYGEASITIENPSGGEDIILHKFTQAVTVTAISAVVIGGTSVTINPLHGTTVTGADTLLTAPEVIATSNASGEHINGTGAAMATTLSDVTLVAGEILRILTTAIVGTPTALHVTIQYRLT